MKADVERSLETHEPRIADLARRTCERVLDVFPDAVVSTDDQNIGFGTGTGYKGLIFVVTPHRAHVTLGIARGADLPDPARLLEGRGRVHRHVKIREVEDLDRPELRRLMTAAVARST